MGEDKQKKSPDGLGPKTVFTIKHSDIPKGTTQCVKHTWRKLSDNELYCGVCQSAIIVNPEVLETYVR